MPKSVGARTHPCFTPLLIGKGSDEDPSYYTVPFMSSWKDVIILRSLGGGGGGASNPLQKGEEALSADQVKSLGQVNEGYVESLSLLSALLL